MFKDLIGIGSEISSTFMASFQAVIGGLFSRIGSGEVRKIFSAATRVFNVIDRLKPDISVKDAQVQTSTSGTLIPQIFGKVRIAGNIIWSSPIVKSRAHYSTMPVIEKVASVFGLDAGSNSVVIRGSFAIALGVGSIDKVLGIYADDVMIDLSSLDHTIYYGTEDQKPNSVIQSYVGAENTPAFKGMAYVLFHDFPLENYNGRIPNLTFDIVRYRAIQRPNAQDIGDLVSGVNIIPGTGLYVYDTQKQDRYQLGSGFGTGLSPQERSSKDYPINYNTNQDKADFLVSLDDLKKDLPNVKWISLVVTWFCDSTDASKAEIYPGYEYRAMSTEPSKWEVAGFNNLSANIITHDKEDRPIYGGTVSDDAILRSLDEIRKRGYKICFYPMLFIDQLGKPWRGAITGKPADVGNFFHGVSGYNKFIMHYVNLIKGKTDAFVIGSEFIGLTKIKDEKDQFPAVSEFVKLAHDVKLVLGKDVVVTYAGDWSEYHHTDGGWFNMDPLWSSPDIDVIGIDAYFPLTNSPITVYDVDEIMHGWESGEGYDFYYTDSEKTVTKPLSPEYAWKNIRYFWSNTHKNPDGKITDWKPMMKKIWFTEYGFPSVDCATNQPNVFFASDTTDGGFPHLSQGRVDFKAQRTAIYATEKYWKDSDMIEQKFVWTWDARPYPFFPSLLNVWSDGINWKYGHFLNGKVGYSTIADVVWYLCMLSGFEDSQIDADSLDIDIGGYVIEKKGTVREHINLLADTFAFDGYLKNQTIVFQLMRDFVLHKLSEEELLTDEEGVDFVKIANTDVSDFPDEVEVLFQNVEDNYRIGVVRASSAEIGADLGVATYSLGISTTAESARRIASNIIMSRNLKKFTYTFGLPVAYLSQIFPMDILKIECKNETHTIRISSISLKSETLAIITGISDDETVYILPSNENNHFDPSFPKIETGVVPSKCDIIDTYGIYNIGIPQNPFVYCPIYSMYANWKGATVYFSQDNENTFYKVASVVQENVIGYCSKVLRSDSIPYVVDNTSYLEVTLYGGDVNQLYSVSEDMMLANHNLAIVGDEVVSFRDVQIVGNNRAIIRGFLRGRFGTEGEVLSHKIGDRFVLLSDPNLIKLEYSPQSIDKGMVVVVQSKGQSFMDSFKQSFIPKNKSNMDFYPYDISVSLDRKGDLITEWYARERSEDIFYDDSDRVEQACYNLIIQNAKGDSIRKIFVEKQNKVEYLLNMQIEDFGAPISELRIKK